MDLKRRVCENMDRIELAQVRASDEVWSRL
jgi:hypothetical protein